MMKTNWSSTWLAIYQSPSAEVVLFACKGLPTNFIEYVLTAIEARHEKKDSNRHAEKVKKKKKERLHWKTHSTENDLGESFLKIHFRNDEIIFKSCFNHRWKPEDQRREQQGEGKQRHERGVTLFFPSKLLTRFLTTIHFDKSLGRASGKFDCVEHCLTPTV